MLARLFGLVVRFRDDQLDRRFVGREIHLSALRDVCAWKYHSEPKGPFDHFAWSNGPKLWLDGPAENLQIAYSE
jgi:hypothetical protein